MIRALGTGFGRYCYFETHISSYIQSIQKNEEANHNTV